MPVDPPPAIALPVLALGGDDDEDVDRLGEWRELTSGPFELATFPGGHFFLLSESVAEVSARVRAFLQALR